LYALYPIHCNLCIVFYTLYSIHCILCIVFYALYSMHCILWFVFYDLYNINYILCIVLYALFYMHSQYMSSISWIIFYQLYSMHCVKCIICYALYSIHCILCVVLWMYYMHTILCIGFYALESYYHLSNFKTCCQRPTDRQTDIVTRHQTLSHIELLSQLLTKIVVYLSCSSGRRHFARMKINLSIVLFRLGRFATSGHGCFQFPDFWLSSSSLKSVNIL
jgi:hypothetical protein